MRGQKNAVYVGTGAAQRASVNSRSGIAYWSRAAFACLYICYMGSTGTGTRSRAALLLALPVLAVFAARADAQSITTYRGPCDASAAVALDADHFVVANDENDMLSIYRGEQAIDTLDLSQFLGARVGRESDIEAAARVGTRVYWITSHGRGSSGKKEQSRQRFFATEVRSGPTPKLEPVGEPYGHLLHDLATAEQLKPYNLGDAAHLAPEANGLNIEVSRRRRSTSADRVAQPAG